MDARTQKRARISTNSSSRRSNKKSRQSLSFPVSTFSSASPTPFTWTPQPVPRSSVASSILLQEMMAEIREQRAILTTLATQQQELIKDVKKIMSTMGLDDSKPEMMDAEYNYYA